VRTRLDNVARLGPQTWDRCLGFANCWGDCCEVQEGPPLWTVGKGDLERD